MIAVDAPATSPGSPNPYRRLLGAERWSRLPPQTRRRFGALFEPGRVRCYVGRVTAADLSGAGWFLAQLCRLIGAPLPLFAHLGPAAVTVTDHPGNGGQVWTRCYHRRRGFAQCIQSVKRFSGPTGLEEYLGMGLTMPLVLRVRGKRLEFHSAGYQIAIGRWRLALPRFVQPGRLTVIHEQHQGDAFSFEMTLQHPLLGRLVYQRAEFSEAPAASWQA